MWMPRSTRTIIPQSTNAELYSTVYLHHHSPECRCYRVKNNHHLGTVQMPWCTCIIIPRSADAMVYFHHHTLGAQMPRSTRAIIP